MAHRRAASTPSHRPAVAAHTAALEDREVLRDLQSRRSALTANTANAARTSQTALTLPHLGAPRDNVPLAAVYR